MINVSYRRVGRLRFLKLGRLCLSWCITGTYRPIKRAPSIVYPRRLFGTASDDVLRGVARVEREVLRLR